MGCKANEPSSCSIGEEIESEPVHAIVTEGEYPQDHIEVAAIGKTLASIVFTGGACSIAGEKPLNGIVTLKAPTLQEEQTTQPVEGQGTLENNSLELAGQKVFIEGGKTLLKLASGKAFANELSVGNTELYVKFINVKQIQKVGGGLWEVVFKAGGKAEFEIRNETGAGFNLENWTIANEANFKLVNPAAKKCNKPEKLNANKANGCFIAIQAQAKAETTTLQFVYNGGKTFDFTLKE